eukprot:TRINITY_DN1634_c0_g2_i1.p1 TRINITY_DN1634_c0_g2~~TRINITY_DN1634_c0_g2_i1.p1  ORF type:complete len:728 (+),score=240.98 TRINITY_DN1634_c0_g2_i1:560-2743(+)
MSNDDFLTEYQNNPYVNNIDGLFSNTVDYNNEFRNGNMINNFENDNNEANLYRNMLQETIISPVYESELDQLVNGQQYYNNNNNNMGNEYIENNNVFVDNQVIGLNFNNQQQMSNMDDVPDQNSIINLNNAQRPSKKRKKRDRKEYDPQYYVNEDNQQQNIFNKNIMFPPAGNSMSPPAKNNPPDQKTFLNDLSGMNIDNNNNNNNNSLQVESLETIVNMFSDINEPNLDQVNESFHPALTQQMSESFQDGINYDTQATDQAAVSNILNACVLVEKLRERLDILRWEQHHMVIPPLQQKFDSINNSQIEMINMCTKTIDDLHYIHHNYLLAPSYLCKLYDAQEELIIIRNKLKVFQEELYHYSQPHQSDDQRCFATLIIIKQPFPKSIKQHTKSTSSVEDPTSVELVTGPKTDARPVTSVKAELIYEEYRAKRGSFTILNDEQDLDENKIASFTDLRFPHGTRLKMVRLQFSLEVEYVKADGNIGKAIVESNSSRNFIVMTNENQWDSSECVLLKRDCFDQTVETSWFNFANTLQFHYLRSTRQDPAEPDRPLSRYDFEYIHKYKFNNNATISQSSFESFWTWFGKVLHKIRHQKPFGSLWLKGLIYGFITKDEAQKILRKENNGTFLIRFSERRPGKIAIAYNKVNKNTNRKEVTHYLVHPQDAKDSTPLPDFLKEYSSFVYLLQLKTDFACYQGNILGAVEKNEVLSPFYSKKKYEILKGYEPEL